MAASLSTPILELLAWGPGRAAHLKAGGVGTELWETHLLFTPPPPCSDGYHGSGCTGRWKGGQNRSVCSDPWKGLMGERGEQRGGAHLPIYVSHHTLLAFEGTVVETLHIFRVTDLRQEWGMGGGRLQKPQSPSSAPHGRNQGREPDPLHQGIPFSVTLSVWEEAGS